MYIIRNEDKKNYLGPNDSSHHHLGLSFCVIIPLLLLLHPTLSPPPPIFLLSHHPVFLLSCHPVILLPHHLIISSSHHLIIPLSHHPIISSSHCLIVPSSHHLIILLSCPIIPQCCCHFIAIKQANWKARMEWDNKDDQAYRAILLYVNLSVAVLAASSTTVMAAWVALRAAFRQTSPLAIFTEFKNVISQKISMANPTLNIMAMNENF